VSLKLPRGGRTATRMLPASLSLLEQSDESVMNAWPVVSVATLKWVKLSGSNDG
jgi:hypothetical protein